MVHQHFRLVEPLTVAENLALARASGPSARRREDVRQVELSRPLRPGGRPAGADLAALGGRAAARRDPEDALGRPRADPRRADRRADAAGGRGAVRDPPRDGGGGPHGDLHLAQAPRGDRGRRPRDRAPRRSVDRDRASGEATARLAALMVGRDIEVGRRRERSAPVGEVLVREGSRRAATAASTRCATSRSRYARARCSGSPASPGTASASSRRRSPGSVR